MSKTAPNRKNPDLKVLQGTDRPDRETEPPKPRPIVGSCPKWVPRKGKLFWNEYAPILEELGMLSELDRHSFALLCSTYDTWRRAEEELAKEDLKTTAMYRGVKKNPLATIARQARCDFMDWCKEFGMTYASRERMNVKPPPSKGKLGDYLNRGGKED